MPSAMGRSKRPPSFGRSAGARFTVMRPAGKAKPQCARAARTRSLLSRTTGAGSPTILNVGRPEPRCTSTLTRGAASPVSARLSICANPTAPCQRLALGLATGLNPRIALFLFQHLHAHLQLLDQRTAAFQDLGLRVEFLTRHQVQAPRA